MIKFNNEDQQKEVERICNELNKKGYQYKLVNNFLNDGAVIEIIDSIQISGDITIFDNGNYRKNIELKNTGLYYNGKVEVDESVLKLSNGVKYLITGELPLNI